MIPRLLPLLLAALPLAAVAQIRDLDGLETDRRRSGHELDSLRSVRVRLLVQRDALSTQADSLFAVDPESAPLVRVRLASRVLVEQLGDVDRRLDSLEAQRDSLDERLRDTYDWEISRLLGLLTDAGWDDGLYQQLLVYQEERRVLGEARLGARYRFSGELSIADQDGPEEIRQKIGVAQQRVAEYQAEQRDTAKRLGDLERMIVLARMRWSRGQASRLQLLREAPLRLQVGDPGDSGGGELVTSLRLPAARGARALPKTQESVPRDAELLLETRRLKARQQELRELEAVWQERMNAFHTRLARILAGQE